MESRRLDPSPPARVCSLTVWSILFLLALGQLAPAVTLTDELGQPHALPQAGKPFLLVYEDKDASKQNADGKQLLAAWHDPLDNRARVDVWPVADLSKWDFWPARGAALKHVRASAEKEHTHILIDWKGVGHEAYGFARGKSTMLLVGGDGRVLFVSEGDTTPAQRQALAEALRSLGLHAP